MTSVLSLGQEGAELEELRAGLEAALAENEALAADLMASREQAARRARADLEEIRARDALVASLRDRLAGLGRDAVGEASLAEGFQVAMEEAQVATEELEAANTSLRRMVAELEARVAQRTAALEAALVERDRLRHALGDRVRRGLWLAGSFFRPWSFHPGIATPAARRQVEGRLEALCQALALLDAGGDGHRVDVGAYVRPLCEGLGDALGPGGPGAEVRCEVPPGLSWDVGLVLTLGLVVNELVADALRRRPANAEGPVTVSVRRGLAEDSAVVSVAPGTRAPCPAAGPALAALLEEVGGVLRVETWPRPATVATLPTGFATQARRTG